MPKKNIKIIKFLIKKYQNIITVAAAEQNGTPSIAITVYALWFKYRIKRSKQ